MDKTLRNILITSLLIISLSIAYYLLYFLPNKERVLKNTRKECAGWALQKAKNFGVENYDQEAYDDYFKRCLREKGIIN